MKETEMLNRSFINFYKSFLSFCFIQLFFCEIVTVTSGSLLDDEEPSLNMPAVAAGDADEFTPEEIMNKSQAAMAQPLSYKIIVPDILETVVYQKMLSNGTIAILRDTKSLCPQQNPPIPSIMSIKIEYGEKMYNIDLEAGIAVDMEYETKRRRESQNKTKEKNEKIVKTIYKPVEIVQQEGRDCYKIEIEKTIETNANSLSVSSPPAKQLSFRTGYIIDKETFLKHGVEFFLPSGVSQKLEFKNITFQPDLTDDFFQLPPGLEIKAAKSQDEYFAISREIIEAKMPLPPEPPIIPPLESIIAALPPRTVTMPPRQVLTNQKREEIEKINREVIIQPFLTPRKIALIIGNTILITLLIFSFYWKKMKKHHSQEKKLLEKQQEQ